MLSPTADVGASRVGVSRGRWSLGLEVLGSLWDLVGRRVQEPAGVGGN